MDLIKAKPVGEQLAEALRQAILNGELPAGSEIRQENLAKEYGVSRIPVREALQSLERDGLVIAQPNRRMVVAEITDEDLNDHYEARALIEAELASRAAQKIKDRDELTDAFMEGERLARSGDVSGLVRANERFHRAVWGAAGSSRLYTLANQLWTGISPYRPVLFPGQVQSSLDEHRQILDAVIEGKTDLARELMREHILRARDDLLRLNREKGASRAHEELEEGPTHG